MMQAAKKETSARRRYWLAALAASIAGSALHFLYAAVPHPLTALLAPVNESVWEHLKLLFWPVLGAAVVLSARAPCRIRLWCGFLTALLAMPVFLLGMYYLLRRLGLSGLALDILLYYVTIFGGFWLAWRLQRAGRLQRHCGILLMLVILYGASLILFTFAAPPLKLFSPPAAGVRPEAAF